MENKYPNPKDLSDLFNQARLHYGWLEKVTSIEKVYSQGYEDGFQLLEEENDVLKLKLKKALEEVNNIIWNIDNDLGRGAYSFAQDAVKHLTVKE